MTCYKNCEPCTANPGYICHGDFFTTGEYSAIIKDYNITGVTLNQKINNVQSVLDLDTILLLKVFICDSNMWDYSTTMEAMSLLDEIISMLSNDNNSQNTTSSDNNINSYFQRGNHNE